jgi:hypothetical protein
MNAARSDSMEMMNTLMKCSQFSEMDRRVLEHTISEAIKNRHPKTLKALLESNRSSDTSSKYLDLALKFAADLPFDINCESEILRNKMTQLRKESIESSEKITNAVIKLLGKTIISRKSIEYAFLKSIHNKLSTNLKFIVSHSIFDEISPEIIKKGFEYAIENSSAEILHFLLDSKRSNDIPPELLEQAHKITQSDS